VAPLKTVVLPPRPITACAPFPRPLPKSVSSARAEILVSPLTVTVLPSLRMPTAQPRVALSPRIADRSSQPSPATSSTTGGLPLVMDIACRSLSTPSSTTLSPAASR
jgi:hypothetical protein